MSRTRNVLSILMLLVPMALSAQGWQMQPTLLSTRWAAEVNPTNVWPEYPRPQMVRQNWQNLNGLWEYSITSKDASPPIQYHGRILVPFPVESALSGVKTTLKPDQLLWYRRVIDVAPLQRSERLLLHFGAVDYEATVYLNNKLLGMHRGGYQSFTFDVTDSVKPSNNELIVRVYDPTEQGPNPHGKQSLNPSWMTYTASSGIWQTVWLERVPSTYIESVKLTPDVDRSELRVQVALNGPGTGYSIEATASDGGRVVSRDQFHALTTLKINQPRLWSPDDPHLYDLQIRLLQDGLPVDTIQSYFGLRKIEMAHDSAGRARVYLNNRYIYNLAVVDQGFWPESLYTAPTDAALKFDVQAAKALGFNTIRKHLKVEPQRWYYHCDRLGLMVWQDMPSGNNVTAEDRVAFEREMRDNLLQVHNHPSITMWTLFNEGWGAYDQERLARQMKQLDPTRLVNGHSGPLDQLAASQRAKRAEPETLLTTLGGGPGPLYTFQETQFQAAEKWIAGDILDLHFYPGPAMFPPRTDKISILGEHGSFGVHVEGHIWNDLGPFGLGVGAAALTPQKMLQSYAESIERLRALEAQGLSGSGYFETFDVEGEQQGFITYDRSIAKIPVAVIERLNSRLSPRAKNYEIAVEGFTVANAELTPESEHYPSLLSEFQNGKRDPSFLKRLALMAMRLGDRARATEVGDAYISTLQKPYSQDAWAAIVTITRTSKDRGFELLRKQTEAVNSLLGPQTAERKILEIIGEELITPHFQAQPYKQDWRDFENLVTAQHGALGREAVYGAWMMDALVHRDWSNFGLLYTKYFETAIDRSPYEVHSLSYRVLQNVSDVKALEMAARVMQRLIDVPQEFPVLGRYDPIKLDTYANLLYKLCRNSEAIEWQQRAVALSDARDSDLVNNLAMMKRGSSPNCRSS